MRPLLLACLALLAVSSVSSAADLDDPRGWSGPPVRDDGYRHGGVAGPPPAEGLDEDDDEDGPGAPPQGWAESQRPEGGCFTRQTPWGPERLCNR
ncbi:hypothetical protein [Enterovirga rhinocerotis]|uniref:Uncharacterized protein n=1 Tax=Enterovirga rhinocerotis TaxID=1339210 RepID=A0A4R7BHY3_9HYPH|nr:hypothetical protein [Enterovirga rhinocerotis]TDR84533.1 hypothetical protein EV668_4892 [Enterovirga rhinocerotis]